MSVSVEADTAETEQQFEGNVPVEETAGNNLDTMATEDQEQEQMRKEELESRLSSPDGDDSEESLSREERLLEDMLRLKLVGGGASGGHSSLPPKQRIKLYQPRTKLEQFEDILLESQLLDQNLPDLGVAPLDYDKFDLESLSLQEALNGITDYDSADAIFADHDDNEGDVDGDNVDTRESSADRGSCECDSCCDRAVLVQVLTNQNTEQKTLYQFK